MELKEVKVRKLTQTEYEKLTKVIQRKRIEMAYIASVLIMLVALSQLIIQAGREHEVSLAHLMFWAGAVSIGWLPSLWFILKNKRRRNKVLKGNAMGVLAQCVSKERIFREHHGENAKRRYQYHFLTEFEERGSTGYSAGVGGTIREGDKFYIIKLGRRDVFLAKL